MNILGKYMKRHEQCMKLSDMHENM